MLRKKLLQGVSDLLVQIRKNGSCDEIFLQVMEQWIAGIMTWNYKQEK